MRYGLNRAADYHYFQAWRGRKLTPIAAPAAAKRKRPSARHRR
jgi:hypothetical protein